MLIRASRVTGYRDLYNEVLGRTSVALFDDAEPVPVTERFYPGSVVAYSVGDGTFAQTFVCCGPEAPLPEPRRHGR